LDEKRAVFMAALKADILLFKKQLGKEDNTTERILDILAQVGKVQISLELLKSTKIGKTVGRLRNSKNEKVATAALEIVGKWRKVAAAASATPKAKAKAAGGNKSQEPKATTEANASVAEKQPNVNSASNDASAKTNSTEAKAAPEEPKKVEATPISFEHKQSGMRINACKALLRNLMRGTDVTKFGGKSFPAKSTVADVVDAIEIALHEKFQGNAGAYNAQLRSRLSNLRTNEKLRYHVATCIIQPYEFVTMTAQEMASDKAKAKIQEALNDAKEAARSDWAIANHEKLQEQAGVSKDSVSMYRCPACKSEKVSSFAMQTRSADEPMTVFCTCLNPKCGKKFRR
jgi:transcription elongation factor S-II